MLPWLTAERRVDLVVKQRWLLALFDEALLAAVPGLAAAPRLVAPLTLSLFAMLNGAMHWLREAASGAGRGEQGEAGRLGPAEYAALAVACVVAGAEAALPAREEAPPPSNSPRDAEFLGGKRPLKFWLVAA